MGRYNAFMSSDPAEPFLVRFAKGEKVLHPWLELSIGFALAALVFAAGWYSFAPKEADIARFEPVIEEKPFSVSEREAILGAVSLSSGSDVFDEQTKFEVLEQVSATQVSDMSEEEKLQVLASMRIE